MKSSEEELRDTQRQLDTSKTEHDRLKDSYSNLEAELNYTKIKLENAKSQATLAEEKLKLERNGLLNELDEKSQILREQVTESDQIKRLLDDEKSKLNNLEKLNANEREKNSREHDYMKIRVNKLKNEVCEKDESICRLKNQLIKVLFYNHYFNAMFFI